jgi:hypothetical protein
MSYLASAIPLEIISKAREGKMEALEVLTPLSPENGNLLVDFSFECLKEDWFLMEIKKAIEYP